MQILDLTADGGHAPQVADLLIDGFSDTGSESWRTQAEALDAVRESLKEGHISRVALDDSGTVLGWIAGFPLYGNRVWELHPLVVRRDSRGRGVGRALVHDFEAQVRRRGGATVYLGTDDEANRTTLGGVDLYPNPLGAAMSLRNLGGHPFEFYQKVGYTVVGVLPDANGFGKPDIFMAKRLR